MLTQLVAISEFSADHKEARLPQTDVISAPIPGVYTRHTNQAYIPGIQTRHTYQAYIHMHTVVAGFLVQFIHCILQLPTRLQY